MKRLLSLFVLLVFVGSVKATVFSAVADPNACVQADYSRVVPASFSLPQAEPNQPYGSILSWTPGDSNGWEVSAGSLKREWARCCDPEGDAIGIRCLGGTSAAEVQIDGSAGAWSFASVVAEGLNLWRFEAADDKGHARIVTIIAWGLVNTAPVLE